LREMDLIENQRALQVSLGQLIGRYVASESHSCRIFTNREHVNAHPMNDG
jgi:hypothetical protein